MKRFLALILTAAILCTLAACGVPETPNAEDPTAPADIIDVTEPVGTAADDDVPPEEESNPTDYGDGDIPESAASFDPSSDEFAPDPLVIAGDISNGVLPVPAGMYYYEYSAGEDYSAYFYNLDTENLTGSVTLYHNGNMSAAGDFYVEQVIINVGEKYNFIYLNVAGLNAPVADLHIMNYVPKSNHVMMYELIEVIDGELNYITPKLPDGVDGEFLIWLDHQE